MAPCLTCNLVVVTLLYLIVDLSLRRVAMRHIPHSTTQHHTTQCTSTHLYPPLPIWVCHGVRVAPYGGWLAPKATLKWVLAQGARGRYVVCQTHQTWVVTQGILAPQAHALADALF